MKKSNKITLVYVLSSLSLLFILIFGGIYGIYISIGLNFVKSSVSNITNVPNANNVATNVSLGGSVNFQSSMTGVIILSIVLIILSVLDFISLIRQVVLFKQFKAVSESKIEQKIEKKVKSKGAVLFFAFAIDIASFAVGIVGIFLNARTFIESNLSWVLYLIDGLVSLFALLSIILLIVKLKKVKQYNKLMNGNQIDNSNSNKQKFAFKEIEEETNHESEMRFKYLNIDELEYRLLKLKHLKSSKIISADEYDTLRLKILGIEEDELKNIDNKN